jgi:hypothetical protein
MSEGRGSVVRTDAVHIVFTTPEETLEAVRVASALGRAMAVPLTLDHFCPVPYPLAVDEPVGVSPAETEAFLRRVRSEGIDVRVRVHLCRDRERVLASAFNPHSLVVIAGRRGWWSRAERLRRRLEAAGHFVVFVDAASHDEPPARAEALRGNLL